jgi:glycerol-3-phosphate dehydrogenase
MVGVSILRDEAGKGIVVVIVELQGFPCGCTKLQKAWRLA